MPDLRVAKLAKALVQSSVGQAGKNESGRHWDMLCGMAESQIRIAGELFYKDGHPII